MIASAVIIPDAPDLNGDSSSANTPTLKRRHADSIEPELEPTKRARLSPDLKEKLEVHTSHLKYDRNNEVSPSNSVVNGSGTVLKQGESTAARADRRRTGREEERKRGQRMMGALLGALGGAGSRGAGAGVQKRRAEIEKRAQAKLKQLDEEGRKKEKETTELIRRRRRREQWIVDEQTMRTNHDNISMTARFLSTRAEPQIVSFLDDCVARWSLTFFTVL
jgi:hypothetical protein